MNKLPPAKRVQILSMLCEGMAMRAISRVCDVSINTVVKMLVDAGEAAKEMHDELVRGVNVKRVQADEVWSFCYSKQRNVATAKAAPIGAGDVWTWTALDADSKLILSYFIGDRSKDSALRSTWWRSTRCSTTSSASMRRCASRQRCRLELPIGYSSLMIFSLGSTPSRGQASEVCTKSERRNGY